MGSQSIIIYVPRYLDTTLIVSRDVVAHFGIGILYRRLWNRGSRKEESAEKIIARAAAMSYRLRLLPAVSHSDHNFTGDSRGTIYLLWITKRGRKGWRKRIRSLFSFSLLRGELFTGLETTRASNPK